MLRFTSTERSGKVLHYKDFQYTLKRERTTVVEWRCRSRKCSSTLSLSRDNTVVAREPSEHASSCIPDAQQLAIAEAVDKMKKRAREETTSIPKIYAQEIVATRIANPCIQTGLCFPTLTSLDSALYHHRSLNYPPLPKRLEDLIITGSWGLSRFGEKFLLVDETSSKRNRLVYDKIFNYVISLGAARHIQFKPEKFICDFELAALQAFSALFPSATTHACFFHYSQALWEKIQDLKLTRLVSRHKKKKELPEEELESAIYWFNGAIGLALIPPSIVRNTWVDIMDTFTPDNDAAIKFNDYLVENYVDGRFPIDLWNVNQLVAEKLPRTNNHVEGYNQRMKTVFPLHPHIYEFIRLLKDEHVFQQHQAEESQVQLRKRRKRNIQVDLLLEQLLKQYTDGQISGIDLAIKCGLAVKTKHFK